jgi:hypothetical protein
MTVLSNIQELFPRGESRISNTVTIVVATITVVLSVIVATTSSTWILSGTSVKIDSLTTLWQRDHQETSAHIDRLTSNVNSLSIQSSSIMVQIENLKQALIAERADRLESERRFYDNRK